MRDRRLIIVVLALAMAAFGGCGENEEKQMTPEEAMGFEPSTEKAETGATKRRKRRKKGKEGFKANPSWERVAPHFLDFASQMDDEIHNPALSWKYRDAFQGHLDKFFPPETPKHKIIAGRKDPKNDIRKVVAKKAPGGVKSILEALKRAGTQPIELIKTTKEEEVLVDPLQAHPLTAYSFQIILSGTSNPEAQVLTPKGDLLVIHVNDRIGKEGGYVQDILKQEVLIKIPEQDAPEIVSLTPPILPSEFGTP